MTNESIPSHNSEYVPKHAKKEQAEVLPDARQRYKRKVEGYYLSGGHPDYLSSYDVHITGHDHERAISLINGGRIDDRAEDALLRRVEPAIGQRGENAYDVVYNINQSETAVRQGKLINYFTGAEHARPSGIGVDEVKSFYRLFPTPKAFESSKREVLNNIRHNNGEERARLYVDVMRDLETNVYGEQAMYWEAMNALRSEAAARARSESSKPSERAEPTIIERRGNVERNTMEMPRERSRRAGRKTLNSESVMTSVKERFSGIMSAAGEKLKSRETLFQDYGLTTISRGELKGNPNQQNQDSAFIDAGNGIFAVFDGAGGERGGAEASRAAVRALETVTQKYGPPNSASDMRSLVGMLNKSVLSDPSAGITTAVIGRIMQDERGERRMLYASVGDSRIYHIRGKTATQITHDEGIGRIIYNSLGAEDQTTNQIGFFPLRKGDSILFNSDGITGDVEKDFIPNEEIAGIVSKAGTPKEAATNLVRRATKIDDRTALVVKI